jgi:hypothetical protein
MVAPSESMPRHPLLQSFIACQSGQDRPDASINPPFTVRDLTTTLSNLDAARYVRDDPLPDDPPQHRFWVVEGERS